MTNDTWEVKCPIKYIYKRKGWSLSVIPFRLCYINIRIIPFTFSYRYTRKHT